MHDCFLLMHYVMKAVNCTVIVVTAYTSVCLYFQTISFSNSVINTVTAFSKDSVPLVSSSVVDRLVEVESQFSKSERHEERRQCQTTISLDSSALCIIDSANGLLAQRLVLHICTGRHSVALV